MNKIYISHSLHSLTHEIFFLNLFSEMLGCRWSPHTLWYTRNYEKKELLKLDLVLGFGFWFGVTVMGDQTLIKKNLQITF